MPHLFLSEMIAMKIRHFFYSHANETYYHKKDLLLALLREREGLWNAEIAC